MQKTSQGLNSFCLYLSFGDDFQKKGNTTLFILEQPEKYMLFAIKQQSALYTTKILMHILPCLKHVADKN